MRILERYKEWRLQEDNEKELSDLIIKSLREESERWVIDEYHAKFGELCIWIANSPYADMTINRRRLKKIGELRNALGYCLMKRAKSILLTPSHE